MKVEEKRLIVGGGLLVLVGLAFLLGGCESVLNPVGYHVNKQLERERLALSTRADALRVEETNRTFDKIEAEQNYQIAGIEYNATIARIDVRLSDLQTRRDALDARWEKFETEAQVRQQRAEKVDNLIWAGIGFGGASAVGLPVLASWLPRARRSWNSVGKKDTTAFFRDQIRYARESVPEFNNWMSSDHETAKAFREAMKSDEEIHSEIVKNNLHKPRVS